MSKAKRETELKEDHYQRLLIFLDKQEKAVHPVYGPCDAIADGWCTECEKRWAAIQGASNMLAKTTRIELNNGTVIYLDGTVWRVSINANGSLLTLLEIGRDVPASFSDPVSAFEAAIAGF